MDHVSREVPRQMLVLKTLVIGFAVLLIVAAGILIAFAANRLGGTKAVDLASLPIPAGCAVEQMTAEGDRLILSIGGRDDCRRVLIADMKSGKVIGQFDLNTPQ